MDDMDTTNDLPFPRLNRRWRGTAWKGGIMKFEYDTADEVAKRWSITRRRVNELCLCGRLKGAVLVGNLWLIPKHTEKPKDGRTMTHVKAYGTFTKHK